MYCRCDGNNDCNDASDEVNCSKISVLDSYLNEVPAPPLNGNKQTEIILSLDIIEVWEHINLHSLQGKTAHFQVLSLEEVASTMKLQYMLQLAWHDPRVTFMNLKKDTHMNSLTNEDANHVWYPKVTFYNTDEMEETEVGGNEFNNNKM